MTERAGADLVVRNARVYTVDPSMPWAGAVAVRDGRISWVGPDDDVDRLVGAGTHVIDVEGRLVLPGFIDSHNHVRYGVDDYSAELGEAHTVDEVRAVIAAWLREHPEADWVEGERLDHATVRLTVDDLDGVLQGRPAFIFDYSGHGVWVNRAAMDRLGITRDVIRLPYGVVEKDQRSGEPTGFLSEYATMGLAGPGHQALAELIPWGSPGRRYRRLTRSLGLAVECGITTVVEPQSGLDDLELYERARHEGALRCHLIAAMFLARGASMTEVDAFDEARHRFDDDGLRVGPIKLYVDDVIEQHTAALFDPYADAPSTRGDTFYGEEEFADLVTALDARQFQILVHAIGDRGVHVALNAFERARTVNGVRDSRHQLIHIELLGWPDVPRFRELGVVACMQPRHCAEDVGAGPWRAAVGEDRWPRAWAWRSLAGAGANLAFSSDWPVAEMDPLLGIYTAMTRRDLAGGQPFVPEQTVDLNTAIRAYTIGGAFANFCEETRGSLAPGKEADLVVVSDNIFDLAPEQIRDCRVELTMIGGAVGHRLL